MDLYFVLAWPKLIYTEILPTFFTSRASQRGHELKKDKREEEELEEEKNEIQEKKSELEEMQQYWLERFSIRSCDRCRGIVGVHIE